jgi:hypothetical protein
MGGSSPAPTPEGSWAFRRAYIYVASLIGLGLIAALVLRLTGQRELMWLALALVVRDAWRETLYIVAPSAQAIVAAIAAWRGRA